MRWFVPSVGFLAALTLVAALGGLSQAHDTGLQVLESTSDRIEVRDARWFVAEAHAPADGTFEAEGVLTVETPPNDVLSVFAFFDQDWNPVDFLYAWLRTPGDPIVVRASPPTGPEVDIETPSAEDADVWDVPRSENSIGWVSDGDDDGSLVGYVAVLNGDDHPWFNITENADGWLGEHTQGRELHQVHAQNFEEVGFHGQVGQRGPTVTVDAHETVQVDDSLVGSTHLTPGGPGKAGWDGPGNRGQECDEVLEGDCNHWRLLSGPSGDYNFSISRFVQSHGHEPSITVADVERP